MVGWRPGIWLVRSASRGGSAPSPWCDCPGWRTPKALRWSLHTPHIMLLLLTARATCDGRGPSWTSTLTPPVMPCPTPLCTLTPEDPSTTPPAPTPLVCREVKDLDEQRKARKAKDAERAADAALSADLRLHKVHLEKEGMRQRLLEEQRQQAAAAASREGAAEGAAGDPALGPAAAPGDDPTAPGGEAGAEPMQVDQPSQAPIAATAAEPEPATGAGEQQGQGAGQAAEAGGSEGAGVGGVEKKGEGGEEEEGEKKRELPSDPAEAEAKVRELDEEAELVSAVGVEMVEMAG